MDLSRGLQREAPAQRPPSMLGTQQHHRGTSSGSCLPAWALVGPTQPPVLPLAFPGRVGHWLLGLVGWSWDGLLCVPRPRLTSSLSSWWEDSRDGGSRQPC